MADEPKTTSRPPIAVYRPPGRPGVEPSLVHAVADQLLERGERPTIARVRELTGGSPNTLGPLLDEWWKGLSGRLRSKAPSAFDRLPGQLGLIAEALFQEALVQARRRAQAELTLDSEKLEHRARETDIQTHVLSRREQELSELVRAYRDRSEDLERQLKALELSERKARAAENELSVRVRELLEELVNQRKRSSRSNVKKKTSTKKAAKKKVAKKPAKKRPGKKVTKRKGGAGTKKSTHKAAPKRVKKAGSKPAKTPSKKASKKKPPRKSPRRAAKKANAASRRKEPGAAKDRSRKPPGKPTKKRSLQAKLRARAGKRAATGARTRKTPPGKKKRSG